MYYKSKEKNPIVFVIAGPTTSGKSKRVTSRDVMNIPKNYQLAPYSRLEKSFIRSISSLPPAWVTYFRVGKFIFSNLIFFKISKV